MNELLGFGAFLFLVATFAIWHNRNAIREWLAREPVSLDALDAPQTHRPADASTGSAGRCNQHRPHRMKATKYGWRCANGCGERWLVEHTDDLAIADFALWDLENSWEVS